MKLWIVPQNTLEQKTLLEMLLRNNELAVITNQNFSATWQNLEPKILSLISSFDEIYGIQLRGKVPLHAVALSPYFDEQKQESIFPLEQVAKMIDSPLNLEEQFVLANMKGYIPAMKKLGESMGLSASETFQKIQEVRLKDRQCQGISQADENKAIQAISQALNGLTKSGETYSLVSIHLPHNNYSTVIDRLYGLYENLLITDSQNTSHFYGSKDVLERLLEDFQDGHTDKKEIDGFYYWKSSVDSAAIQNSIQTFIQERNTLLEDDRIQHLTPRDILNEQNIDEKVGRVMIETPDSLKHLSVHSGTHSQKVSRKFYENGSIYTQEGTAIVEIKNKLHFMDDIENTTQWAEPQKESEYPLSYEEKVLVLMNNGPYSIPYSLVSKTSSQKLIPDLINLLRQARFNPEQFHDLITSTEEEFLSLRDNVTTLSKQFSAFISSNQKTPKYFADYEKWCNLSKAMTDKDSTLEQLKEIDKISHDFENIIKKYETIYFEANRPRTSKEHQEEKKENSTPPGTEPYDD